ncbi:MAG: dihydropteroate synthase [Acidimicrobiales bacterium]
MTYASVVPAASRQPKVMGILNVTPDSFFDGGLYFAEEAAMARGREMFAQGADIVDVGGESSRPGATEVDEQEELRRVLPVIRGLAPHGRVSVDTVKAGVADAALDSGASLLNDVSGTLWEVAAARGAPWVAMHRKGTPADMQVDPRYDDVVQEVHDELVALALKAKDAGVHKVWIDPGIGFGKTVEHNLSLLRELASLVDAGMALGCPVMVGTSNKWFLGAIASGTQERLGTQERSEASLASATWAMSKGVSMVRVHEVGPASQAARLVGSGV